MFGQSSGWSKSNSLRYCQENHDLVEKLQQSVKHGGTEQIWSKGGEVKKNISSEIWTEGFEKQNTCHTQISGHAEMQLALQYNMRVGTGGAKGPNTQTRAARAIPG